MNKPAQALQSIQPLLAACREAALSLRTLSDQARSELLRTLAEVVGKQEAAILRANEQDLARMEDTNPKKDRLRLTPSRISALVDGILAVADLPDPAGKILLAFQHANGMQVQKVSVPLGVVGIIYESRPNVTLDVAALCLRSGNAAVLRGGSDAASSNVLLTRLIHQALEAHSLPPPIVTLLPTDRKWVKELLTATSYVDILIPRGSQQLIDFVRQEATVPTIETGAGVCHTYVHASADLAQAAAIAVNAKVSRPSVCNALDTLLVDRQIAAEFLPKVIPGMEKYQVGMYADRHSHDLLAAAGYPFLHPADAGSFGKEYLSFNCSVKVVDGLEEALAHIRQYSSRHSECIVARDETALSRFIQSVDAAAVYANASTRFTDGGEFGLGAEIGISTQKLHARGPFALEKLVTEKWIVTGQGQIRE